MSPPRKGARRPPAATQHPPAFPSIEAILAERPWLQRVLLSYGVQPADVDDVLQEIAIGATRSIAAGRYRPDPAKRPERSLRGYLVGVALKQIGHYHHRAHRRHEVVVAEPWRLTLRPRVDPACTSAAREALAAIEELPTWARDVLVLAAHGCNRTEIAALLGPLPSTASSRLRLARKRLRRKLRRRL